MISSEGDKTYIRIPPCDLECIEVPNLKGRRYLNQADLIAWIRLAAIRTTDTNSSQAFEFLADQIEKLRKQ